MNTKYFQFTRFQIFIHAASLAPFIILVIAYLTDNVGFDPVQTILHRTGRYAMIWVLISLTCTPLNTILGFSPALKVRRALGMYSFFYASLHFLTYSVLDYGLNFSLIFDEIIHKNYLIIGASALLILIALAITSTKKWMKRLGRNWTRLHQLVYVGGILIILHFVLAVKADFREPLIYGGLLAFLLVLRIPVVRKQLSAFRPKWVRTLNRALAK